MQSSRFQMDPDWLVFEESPTKPRFVPPAGAVDAHCHVFGPGSRFPFARERKYTPCDATKDQLWRLRDFLGFERNVIVQATCHGADNRAMADAIESSNGCARGVATIGSDITDDSLRALDTAGVRGVRFNFVKRLVDVLPRDELLRIVERVQPLGWHIVIYFEAPDLAELYGLIAGLPLTVVVDHMGRPDLQQPVEHDQFQLFVKLLQENPHVWSKVTCPERLSASGPPTYDDFVPFARTLVEAFPDRVLWGTDWPHPNMKSHMPDDGLLVDIIPRIATTHELQHQLLVNNPRRLYWAEEVD